MVLPLCLNIFLQYMFTEPEGKKRCTLPARLSVGILVGLDESREKLPWNTTSEYHRICNGFPGSCLAVFFKAWDRFILAELFYLYIICNWLLDKSDR